MSSSSRIERKRIRPAAVAVLAILAILFICLFVVFGQASAASHASQAPDEGKQDCLGQPAFTAQTPAVTNLDPALLGALRCASDAATQEGIFFTVTSGWRTPEEQQQLLDEAIVEHGSLAEALRWAATPETSQHVMGDAVDLGPSDAAAWLSENGATYGLCQIYANESWHFELRPDAVTAGCPPMYADPTQDPRMQG
jgi:hypothetical protein